MRKLRKHKPQQIRATLEMTEALRADSTSRAQACRQLDRGIAVPVAPALWADETLRGLVNA